MGLGICGTVAVGRGEGGRRDPPLVVDMRVEKLEFVVDMHGWSWRDTEEQEGNGKMGKDMKLWRW